MITAPTNWNTLWADSSSSMELRFTLGEDVYLDASIGGGSCKLAHDLYDGIGNACSARLNITLWDVDAIAEGMLECTLECRLVSANGNTTTAWVNQGTYYLDTVEYDDAEKTAKLTCYDAMALTDIYLYEDGVASGETWPKTASQIVSQVCTRTGISAPASTTGWGSIQCGNVDFITCRQALQSIAACAGGNWTVTKANALKFIPLKGLSGTSTAGSMSVSDIKQTSKTHNVGGLILKNGDNIYERGSGVFVIQAESLYANDTIAGTVYNSILNLQYAGFRATGCYVTPLVELGDLLTVDDSTAKVFVDSVTFTYDGGLWGTVTAPLQDGVEQRIRRRGAYESAVDRLTSQTSLMQATIDSYSTAQYISDLLGRINAEANATGGYTYITEGGGIVTYDVPVSDPLVGAEALKMTAVKGGLIYIANRSSTSEPWQLQSMIQDGHIVASLVTASNITTGYIGSVGSTFIDLDNNTVNLGDSTKAHMVISNTEVAMSNNNTPVLDFVGDTQTYAGTVYSGVHYTLGSRAAFADSDNKHGLYSLTVGTDNYAANHSYYSATFGRGLYATGNGSSLGSNNVNGLAIGRYNAYTTSSGNRYAYGELLHDTHIGDSTFTNLLFVIGDGTNDANRKNIAEINTSGSMALSGKIYADNLGRYYSTGLQTVDNTGGSNSVTIASVDIGNVANGYGVWVACAEVYLSGSAPTNNNAAIQITYGTSTTATNEAAKQAHKTTDRQNICGIVKTRVYSSSSTYINLRANYIYQSISGKLTVARIA